MMDPILLALDCGTTAVKAAAFAADGRMIATAERANGALRRDGVRVEQDMTVTRDEAFAALRDCVAQIDAVARGRIVGLVLTGQGDGLWPVDAAGQPVGHAMTWLDGRARGLVAEMGPQLDAVQAITGSRPTAAAASLQLLWLQRHDPDRLAAIRHALRLKEWLLLCLTGQIAGEPTAALPVWGRWQTGDVVAEVSDHLGLGRGIDLLPPFAPVGQCRAPLSSAAAAAIGLSEGLPVLLGPGDVQATFIGMGLGTRPGVQRGSIFGTSSIHACLQNDPSVMTEAPAGAMVQRFALGEGYLCFHPSFNGATLLHHLARQFRDLPNPALPAWSGLILHPFLEPGGERAPWTDPDAKSAILGLTASTTPAEIAWMGREALAFVACHSHAMLGGRDGQQNGALSLGGGLAADPHFAQFLATTLGCPVQRNTAGHAGLRGLAAIGARYLLGATAGDLGTRWLGPGGDSLAPQTGAVAEYAAAKFRTFTEILQAVMPLWAALSALRAQAETLTEQDPT
ncbi:FGGY family carbohydrate kinase [Gemmobacter serpentinus]|uniref:FGGY family carbohydrate kinase n=1 Tax=Gemmobacter serpentinus TaxID=2652247 RepID=UPI001CF6FAF5|nr:FGGY family carbohydrate kinase [Gemmobacter serpentinus]